VLVPEARDDLGEDALGAVRHFAEDLGGELDQDLLEPLEVLLVSGRDMEVFVRVFSIVIGYITVLVFLDNLFRELL
jgi:hypothetical protein